MKSFELVLKNEKQKYYRTLASLVILINLFFLAWLSIADKELRIKAIITAVIVLAGIVLPYFTKKFQGKAISFFFIVLFHFETGYWQLAAVLAILALLYFISVRPLVVQVSQQRVVYPSFPRREIEWNELDNLILKDGLLSIDFKNNRLAQAMIATGPDEQDFNEFCQARLRSEPALKN